MVQEYLKMGIVQVFISEMIFLQQNLVFAFFCGIIFLDFLFISACLMNPGQQRRLAVTQTPVEEYQRTRIWKAIIIIIIIIIITIIIIIIIMIVLASVSHQHLLVVFHFSSRPKDTFEYSGRSQQCSCLDSLL